MLTAKDALDTATKRAAKLIDQTLTKTIREIDRRSMDGHTDVWVEVPKHISKTIIDTLTSTEMAYTVDPCDNLGEELLNLHISWGQL